MTTNLIVLRNKMDRSKAVYDAMGMRNVHGLEPDALVQMDIEYEHAKRQWLDDYIIYQRAIEAHCAEGAA